MTVAVNKVVAAAKALATSNLRIRLEAASGEEQPIAETWEILQIIFPHIQDLLIMVDAAEQVVDILERNVVASGVEKSVSLPQGFELDTDLFAAGVFSGCSGRARNGLRSVGLTTPRTFCHPPEINGRHCKYLRSEPNVGRLSVRMVREALAQAGFNPDEFECLKVN